MPVRDSHISTGIARMFDGPGMVSAPSKPWRAPNPPVEKKIVDSG